MGEKGIIASDMSAGFSIFYSNRVEELFQELKRQLFAPPLRPFARRLVVVSSPPLKSWLMLQMAQDPEIGIAAGLEISYPEETLKKLAVFEKERPTCLELALSIEQHLRAVLQLPDQKIWTPLAHYLQLDAKR